MQLSEQTSICGPSQAPESSPGVQLQPIDSSPVLDPVDVGQEVGSTLGSTLGSPVGKPEVEVVGSPSLGSPVELDSDDWAESDPGMSGEDSGTQARARQAPAT